MRFLLRLGALLIAGLLIIAALFLWSGPSYSQPSDRCAPLPLLEYAMERMTEQLMAVGTVGGFAVRFYVDPVGRGWTVLQINSDGMACKVIEGTAFDFVRPAPPGNPS